jgi:hypothetical protein
VATSKCRHCGQDRTAADELGLYCSNLDCGRPRLPFSWIFVWPWLALTATYFFTEMSQPDARRPLLTLTLVLATAWCSTLILRHRRHATVHVITILIALTVVLLHPARWGSTASGAWPSLLANLSTFVVVAAWMVLVGYVIFGLGRGFTRARKVGGLGSGSLLVVVMALLGVIVTILYFVLPVLISAVRETFGLSTPRRVAIDVLTNIEFVVNKIEQYRLAALLLAGFIVLGIATISALRGAYKNVSRFSALGQASRVLRAIARNVLELVRDSITRLLLILRGIAPILLLVAASGVFVTAVFELVLITDTLWTSTRLIPLEVPAWAVFGVCIVVCALTWIAMLAVGSSRLITDSGRAARELVKDLPQLGQAVVYSIFILSLSFLLTWVIALAYQVAFDQQPVGVFLFLTTVCVYAVLAVAQWFVSGRKAEVGERRASLLSVLSRRPDSKPEPDVAEGSWGGQVAEADAEPVKVSSQQM